MVSVSRLSREAKMCVRAGRLELLAKPRETETGRDLHGRVMISFSPDTATGQRYRP